MAEVGPKTSQYRGRFAVDPVPTEAGQWWYNTGEQRLKWYDGAGIRSIGRWEEASVTQVVAVAGDYIFYVPITGLNQVEVIFNIRIDTDPVVDPGTPTNAVISGNAVGFTLMGVGGGTTLTAYVLAQGRM
jgi:hypothetical protein